jgi:pimeloyl-ACP methyl ester carboxylesterase
VEKLIKNKLFKSIVRIIVYPFVIFFIISIVYFYLYSIPRRYVSEIKPSDIMLKYESVKIRTSDDIELKGWFIPSNIKTDKAIILLHGWAADKGDIFSFTNFLSQRYNLLYIDFRAMGESGGRFSSGGYTEIRDLKAAIDFLKKRGYKVGVYGYSMGSFVALLYLFESNDISFAIADSPYDSIYGVLSNFFKIYGIFSKPIIWLMNFEYRIVYGKYLSELSIQKNIEKIRVPVLFICGTKDEICYGDYIRNYRNRNHNISALILDGFGHNETVYYKNYEDILFDFVDKNF